MSNTPPNPPFDAPADPFSEPVERAAPTSGYTTTPLYDQVDVETSTTPPVIRAHGFDSGDSNPGDSNPGDSNSEPSKTDTAKDQAAEVAATAAAEAQNVAGVAKEKASEVVAEAKTQVKDLLDQSKETLREQAGAQQERVATGLRSLGDELQSMSDNSDGTGVASDLVAQLASRAGSAASWLDGRDPGSLLDEVRTFAQRKPGTFIAIAAIAGVVAGRLTRSVTAVVSDEHEHEHEHEHELESEQGRAHRSANIASAAAVTPPFVEPVTPTTIPTVPPAVTGL